MSIRIAARSCIRTTVVVVVAMCVSATAARSQSAIEQGWTISAALGGYVEGNGRAVSSWLKANGYGVTEPARCGFDILLQAVCGDPTRYPHLSGSGAIGWMVGFRHPVSEKYSLELLAASEQSGALLGRCDDQQSPRDVRCTQRFITVDIGGASVGGLAIYNRGILHYGVGPAVLFANWSMQPSHLPGVWLDVRLGGDAFPLYARAQYRFYKSASFAPSEQFTGFHPSTLFIGGGLRVQIDDSR